jgi:hypothetical protein
VRELERSDNRIVAEVRGFRGDAVHHRTIEYDGLRIEVRDEVRPHRPAQVRYHFAYRPMLVGSHWRVSTPQGRAFLFEPGGAAFECHRAPGWTAIGREAPRWCLWTPVPAAGLRVAFRAES